MCIFSQTVELVSNTSIFARRTDGRQLLAYSMTYRAATPLAMVLPLPVPAGGPEDSVGFIDLEEYSDFFTDLRSGFPILALSRSLSKHAVAAQTTLTVHNVGWFEASFVPTLEDFDRLDDRFRIPPDAMSEIPEYLDYGFAVFKLKQAAEDSHVHPMAFEFPQRDPERLFFPTVHVHDGRAHERALFDHTLFCQVSSHRQAAGEWEQSKEPAAEFMDVVRAEGLVDGQLHCWRKILSGTLPNTDIWL